MKTNKTNRVSHTLTAAAVAAVLGGSLRAADVDVIDVQTSFSATYGLDVLTANTTWTKDNVYILTDRLYVPNGLTLTIEAGTKIYSTSDDQALIGDPVDDTVGALIVARGGKLEANGTASEPIVFDALQTLEAERGCDLPYDSDSLVGPKPTITTNGLWGGIVVLGNAYIAVTDSSGNNIGNKIIEGFVPSGFVDSDSDTRPDILEYGFDTLFSQDDADDSGTISHVSIRHGGYTFGTDNEINGLTLAGVGSGTTIEYVEVVANQDDGVEFFGGTVNTNNIVVAFCGDDSFDIDEGHQGTHQFWFAIQNPNDGDNLGEWDGVGGASKGSTNAGVIRSNPMIYNATFVGPGADSFLNANAGKDNSIFMDDFFNGQVINSVLLDSVNYLTEFSSDGDGGGVVFTNNTIGDYGRYNDLDDDSVLANAPFGYYVDDTFLEAYEENTVPNTVVGLTDYTRSASGWLKSIDPRPLAGSSPLVDVAAAGAPVVASYRGAFDGTTNWASGWTFLDENGYFTADATPTLVDVIATQTSFNATYGLDVLTANTTWTKDNVYILTDRLYVPNGLTLTIEAGTKIYSTSDDQALIGDPVDDTVGALIVARGGKLEANGTASEPIVFDALQTLEAELGYDLSYDSDNLVGPKPTITTNGLWGGIVVLGNAYIAVTDSSGNNIGNKIIEGFVPSGFVDSDSDTRPDILEYGFDTLFSQDDADDSGTISHVSIRHGGYTFGTDNEINGLTLAGVGSGTTIEYVEVVANQDDGVEFFGGTVNTNNIVVAFCGDDSFDIDEGHQGTHQFWFAIQNPNDGDNLGEWDGVGGASKGSTNAGVIRSNPMIYNATFVGPGADSFLNANAGKDNSIFMDDFFNGQVINSVLLDSVNYLTEFSSDGDGGGVVFTNNTIGDYGRYNDLDDDSVLANAPFGYYVDDTFLEAYEENTVPNTMVGLTDYTRSASGWLKSIDPRPLAGSSPLVDVAAAGAPVVASYRGAFDGTTNWASGWTFLDENGYFGADVDTDGDGLTDAEEGTLGTNPALYDTDGDGVSDGFEVANASKGFNPLVNDATAVLAGLSSEQELLNIGYFANTIDGSGSVLTLELEGSTTLGGWSYEQDVNVPLPSGTKFYRFTDGN